MNLSDNNESIESIESIELLLKIMKKTTYENDDAYENENDDVVYQSKIMIEEIEKNIDSFNQLQKIIQLNSAQPAQLENILYTTDKYNCTALHYACRYSMIRIALLIMRHTTKESNLYKVSTTGITPLIICCRQGQHRMQSVFNKILERTENEDNLYLGKNHALQYCIVNKDSMKAISILKKTKKEENLYKPSLRFTSLNMALDKGLVDVSKLIVAKTRVERNLYIPNVDISDQKYKNILFYLKNPLYQSVKDTLTEKYTLIDSYSMMKVKKIFVDNIQPIGLTDIINHISSFLVGGFLNSQCMR
jgi:hypothetical protein